MHAPTIFAVTGYAAMPRENACADARSHTLPAHAFLRAMSKTAENTGISDKKCVRQRIAHYQPCILARANG
jgi:hypothetical protein